MVSKTWDVLVLCARDQTQKEAFELLLAESDLEEFTSIPRRVYADEPEGVKIGGGGALLLVLHKLHLEFGSQLCSMRIVFIPSGGYSQRQPNASALGKIFTVLPRGTSNGDVCTLLLARLHSIAPFCTRMRPGLLLVPSDTLESFEIENSATDPEWNFEGEGFTVVAQPSPSHVAVNHGVYVLEGAPVTTSNCLRGVSRVLQKPSVELMDSTGAFTSNRQAYTDCLYFMASSVYPILLDIYAQFAPLESETDCYGDFLRPLGTHATDEYLTADSDDQFGKIRRALYSRLRGQPIQALVLPTSMFHHLGTLKEMLDHYCVNGHFRRHFHLQNTISSSGVLKSGSSCAIATHFVTPQQLPSTSLFEFNYFEHSVDVSAESVISMCHLRCAFKLPEPTFMTTLAVSVDQDSIGYVTIAFGTFDDLKSTRAPCELVYFGRALGSSTQKLNVGSADTNLWRLPLFAVCESRTESSEETLRLVQAHLAGSLVKNLTMSKSDRRMSMQEALDCKHVRQMLKFRQQCLKGDFS